MLMACPLFAIALPFFCCRLVFSFLKIDVTSLWWKLFFYHMLNGLQWVYRVADETSTQFSFVPASLNSGILSNSKILEYLSAGTKLIPLWRLPYKTATLKTRIDLQCIS